MSEEEEDYLDSLLGDENEEIQDPDEEFGNHQKFICKVHTKMFNKIKKDTKK
jgi:hypothetical protein